MFNTIQRFGKLECLQFKAAMINNYAFFSKLIQKCKYIWNMIFVYITDFRRNLQTMREWDVKGNSQRILWRNPLKGRQVSDVLVVEPFDFEVQIHVLCALAKTMLVVFCIWRKKREMKESCTETYWALLSEDNLQTSPACTTHIFINWNKAGIKHKYKY